MKRRSFLKNIGLGATTAALGVPSLPAAEPAGERQLPREADLTADVLVYGGTSAGVIAAHTAKRYGLSVLLVTPGRHLGGMTSGGLGKTDTGDTSVITGLSRDFYRRIGAYYGRDAPMWRFEPHAAEQVFQTYVDEADVECLFSHHVTSTVVEGGRLQTITLEYAGQAEGSSDLVVAADLFIDTTYEGDLMARAGVSYYVGREPNSMYDETHNGVQMGHPRQFHQFPDGVDPYVVPGDPSSGLLPEIAGVGLAPNGTGDKKIQAYNFRMCLRQGEDRIPIPKPEDYDPARYALLLRDMEHAPPKQLDGELFIISEMPNGKTDWNNKGAFSTDYIGGNWEYPEADYARRKEIWQAHRTYQQGLMYFLAHDERVPGHIREEMQRWGLCPDEFLDTGGWPHALYIREGRRMVGEYVMTDHNIVGEEKVGDGIAYGSYNMDSHNVQRVVVEGPDGPMVKNEGDVEQPPDEPYLIAYGSTTPKPEEMTNLLVPVAVSASHIAFGSIRMEPVFMELGQAAAVAASMALEADVPVQEIEVSALQRELYENPLADGSRPPSEVYRLDV